MMQVANVNAFAAPIDAMRRREANALAQYMPPQNATAGAYGGGGGGDIGRYRDAIASIESAGSGDYRAIGPTHSKLGRALGRYQIMEANIPQWSREALGRVVSPDEFLANPAIQDAIFDHRFLGYVDRFGPQGAAEAWFAGPGGVGKINRKDVLGTTVGAYGQKFNRALGRAPSSQPPFTGSIASMSDLFTFLGV